MAARSAARMKVSDAGPIAAYKTILRDCLDRRPAGMRARIAVALGKHKSFVSQLSNPIYPMPVPARHLSPIVEICHFSSEERKTFRKPYRQAHPGRAPHGVSGEHGALPRRQVLSLWIPELRTPGKQRALEAVVRNFVERVAELID